MAKQLHVLCLHKLRYLTQQVVLLQMKYLEELKKEINKEELIKHQQFRNNQAPYDNKNLINFWE